MQLQLSNSNLWFTFCTALVGACFLVFYLRKPSAPTSNSKNLYPRSTTFRLQGIPALLSEHQTSKNDVIYLIRKAWNIGDSAAIVIHSLATDPSDDTKKIATLSFRAPPQFTSRSVQRWTATVSEESDGSIDLALDVEFFGLTPVHHEPDAKCTYDIVALSGLNGHAFGSFKQRGESSFMWLRDALPQHLTQAEAHARVFIYGYDSRLIKSNSFQEISDLGLEFKNKMVQLTQGSSPPEMRRLILIGHSLGGILVKQTIISLNKDTPSTYEKRTLERLLGSMFFGTPSQGMDIATILPMVDEQPNELLVRTLGHSTGTLRSQMDDFRRSFERMSFSVVWYYETSESSTARRCESGKWKMDGPKRRLVDISSATNGMPHDYGRHTVRPINRSHSELVKFQGPTDEIYRQVLGDIKNIISSPESVKEYSLADEQKAFLESLDFTRQDFRRDNIASATENTCAWFFHSYKFQDWIDSKSAASGKGLLWVKGNPGVGKSTLMREALRRARDYVSQASTNIVSFFFNARGEELEKATLGLYRSFLHQVLKHDLSALVFLLPDYQEKKKGKIRGHVEWTEQVLKDYVSRVCQRGISKPVVLFVDALDECTDPEISRMVEFFQGLVDQKKDANENLRLCISSRHCPRPPTFGYPEITVEHHNKDDIYTYIKAELKNYESLLKLRNEIVQKSRGVFLWVQLAIKQLRKEEDRYSGRPMLVLRNKLTDIPSELGDLFGSLLERIDPRERPRAVCMFQLVLFSKTRLSAEEIAASISFHPETCFDTIENWTESGECIAGRKNQMDMIVDLSSGLLEFDNGWGSECQFIHESARDYLVRHEGFKRLTTPPTDIHVVGWCHSAIVTTMVNYLQAILAGISNNSLFTSSGSFLKSSPHEERESQSRKLIGCKVGNLMVFEFSDMPFVRYTSEYIIMHIKIAEREGFSQEASLKILPQIRAHIYSHLSNVFERRTVRQEFDESLLYVCCKLDSETLASRLISMEKDPCSIINERSEPSGRYPLMAAIENRSNCSLPLTELLLRNGADVEARDRKNRTALIRAADVRNLEAIKLLLSYKADLESRGNEGRTVMHEAVRSTKVNKLLLRHGANPNVEDNEGQTPLIIAASRGFFKSLLPLINAGADVNHRTRSGQTAIHNALDHWPSLNAHYEMFGVIKDFIDNGLDLNVRSVDGITILDRWIVCKDYLFRRRDRAAYKMWKELKQLLEPEEGEKSEAELNDLLEPWKEFTFP